MPPDGEGVPPEGDGGGGIPLGCPLEGGLCGGVMQAASANAAVTSSPIADIFLNRIAHLLTSPRGGHADRPRDSILILVGSKMGEVHLVHFDRSPILDAPEFP